MGASTARSTVTGLAVTALLLAGVGAGLVDAGATDSGAEAATTRPVPRIASVLPTSTLYVGESSSDNESPPPPDGGIGVFDPTDLAKGPSATLPAVHAPNGDGGYASVVLAGSTLVGLDGGGHLLRRFNGVTGSSTDQTITGPSPIGPVSALAVSPDATALYLIGTDNGGLQVSEMVTATWTVTTTYDVPGSIGSTSSGIVTVDPATGDLWIPGEGVFVVDPSAWTTQVVLPGTYAGQVAIDGGGAWVPSGGSLVEISTGDYSTVRTIIEGDIMAAVAAPGAPDIYAILSAGGPIEDVFAVAINALTGAFTAVTQIAELAHYFWSLGPMAVSADGSTVFITFNSYGGSFPTPGTIDTLDTATDALTGDVGHTDQVISALVPDPNPPFPTQGYWQVASDGGVFSFGNAAFHGSMGATPLNEPIVGITAGPADQGYWEVAADGGIFSFGSATFHGSMGGHPLSEPVVGIATTPDRQGYWEVAADGGIFAFGDAGFYGSQGGHPLNEPIVGIAATPDGTGYWLVAADGGIFADGDAGFFGSAGSLRLNQPIVGMAATPDGKGYWLVAADGGLFAYGDATFDGAAGGKSLDQPIVGIAPTPDGGGYWLVAADGGIFAYGDATFYGSMGGTPLNRPVVGIGATGAVG
jgi:hypothetical protein